MALRTTKSERPRESRSFSSRETCALAPQRHAAAACLCVGAHREAVAARNALPDLLFAALDLLESVRVHVPAQVGHHTGAAGGGASERRPPAPGNGSCTWRGRERRGPSPGGGKRGDLEEPDGLTHVLL